MEALIQEIKQSSNLNITCGDRDIILKLNAYVFDLVGYIKDLEGIKSEVTPAHKLITRAHKLITKIEALKKELEKKEETLLDTLCESINIEKKKEMN